MIKSIRLINCQSWEDCTIHLASDRLNAIQAKNNVGKSVLIKMLKVSASPNFFKAKKRKKLIRWGAEDARAHYVFTDGVEALVIVQPTRVIYGILEDKEQGVILSATPPKRLIQELGMLVNSDGSFIANIIDTDQNLLLVDADSKSTCEFIQMLCNCAEVDEYIFRITEEQKVGRESAMSVGSKLADINEEIDSIKYMDVGKLEDDLNSLQLVNDGLGKLLDCAYSLERVENALVEYKDYDRLLTLTNTAIVFERLNPNALVVESFNQTALTICDALLNLEKISMNQLLHNMKQLPNLLAVTALEMLESIPISGIFCEEHKYSVGLGEVLVLLNTLNLTNLQIPKKPIELATVNGLTILEDGLNSMINMHTYSSDAKLLQSEIDSLCKKLQESGAIFECQIYGKVIYDGKECVPCDT